MICFVIGTTESCLAESLIAETQRRLGNGVWPVWVSDGEGAYGEALRNRHCVLEIYPKTGRRGRPRKPKLVACPELRYGQVVKNRDGRHRVTGVFKHSVYGDIPLEEISTVYLERHNLNLRHENRRLTRKTIAFSKKTEGLKAQITLYQSYFILGRPHRGLMARISADDTGLQKWQKKTPAIAAGLTDHIWSFRELMTQKLFINR